MRDQYNDHVQWKTVLAVEAEPAHPDIPTRASFWHINFYVDGYRLSLSTRIDTDEIIAALEPSALAPPTEPNLHPVLRELVGRKLGWIWYARNGQGYHDMLILAFTGAVGAGATPQLAFLVEASSISVCRVTPA